MNRRARVVMAWLEGEGARRRRKLPLPPEVGYATLHGWVQVGACFLWGTLAAGLFVCWLAEPWVLAYRVGVGERSFRAGAGMTLEDAKVEEIVRHARAGGPAPLTLIVRHGGLLIPCEFRGEKAPWGVRVGDVVTIRSAAGRAEEELAPALLQDCELVGPPLRPGE